MIPVILTLSVWAAILLITEFLWRLKILRGEYARKAIHIPVNLIIAAMPFFMSWGEIQITGLIGIAALGLMRVTKLFKSLYDIQRFSYGEFFGSVAILVLTLLEPSKILFALVILHIGLADGLAAIVGARFGKGNRYKIFGYTKSLTGTGTFYLVSLIITTTMIILSGVGGVDRNLALLLLLPLAATVTENIGVYGLDNALLAVVTGLIFNNLIN